MFITSRIPVCRPQLLQNAAAGLWTGKIYVTPTLAPVLWIPLKILLLFLKKKKNHHDLASQYRPESLHLCMLQLEQYGRHTPDALECSKVPACFQVTVQSIVDFKSFLKTHLLPNERGLNITENKWILSNSISKMVPKNQRQRSQLDVSTFSLTCTHLYKSCSNTD